eukprot:434024_1
MEPGSSRSVDVVDETKIESVDDINNSDELKTTTLVPKKKSKRKRKFKPNAKKKKDKQFKNVLVFKDKTIKDLQNKLLTKSNEVIKLQKQLNKSRTNMKQIKPGQNERHIQSVQINNSNSLQQDLVFLEDKISEFCMKYDRNTLAKIYKTNPRSLNVEENINNTELSCKWLAQQLKDINKYIVTVTQPQLHKYKQWDIDTTMTWIKSLDNGKYKKYCDVLRKGFESDRITAVDLPNIGQSDLATTPFDIREFKDRKRLAQHFKFLTEYESYDMNGMNNIDKREYSVNPCSHNCTMIDHLTFFHTT